MARNGFDSKHWSNITFVVLFAVSVLMMGRLVWPFALPVLLGAFLAVLFGPFQDSIGKRLRLKPLWAAAATTFMVLVVILIPTLGIAVLVGRELLVVAEQARAFLERPDFLEYLSSRLPPFVPVELLFGGADRQELVTALGSGVKVLTDVLAAGTTLGINVFLMTVALYYFLLDGRRLIEALAELLPLERRYLDAFGKEFKDVTYAILYGNTLTALIQGAVGTVGLVIARVQHAPVWGVVMAGFAMLPIGGTALVWGPIGIALLVNGHTGRGVFLLLWGTLLVSLIDNVLRPKLVGARMAMHPLLVFLSVFGGLAVFGVMGLLVGPLIGALFMAMLRIYKRDFLLPARAATAGLIAPSGPIETGVH